MRIGLLLIGGLLVAAPLSSCTARGLRGHQREGRTPASAASMRSAVGDQPTSTAGPLSVAAPPASPDAPDERTSKALRPQDLEPLGLPIDEALWLVAADPSYEVPSPIDETQALTVFLARSQAIRAARSRLSARRERLGQSLYLERLVEQYDGFARRPDARAPTYPLPGPEALQGAAVARDVALAAEEFRASVLDLMTGFVMAFHEARYQRQSVATYGENLALSRRFADVVRTRYASGQARKADLLKAEMRLAEMTQQLRTSREALSAAEQKLGAALDVAGPVTAGTSARRPATPTQAQVQRASSDSPDLAIAVLEWERAVATLELVERRVVPDLASGLSERLGKTEAARFPAHYVTGSPFAEELRDRVGGRARALDQARISVPAEAERMRATLSEWARSVGLHKSVLVPKAKDALSSTESEYRVGRATYLELDDIQRQWLRVSLEAGRAEREAHVAASRLRRILGRWPASSAAREDAEEQP